MTTPLPQAERVRLLFRSRHHGPDDVCLLPEGATTPGAPLPLPGCTLTPQLAASLALALLGLLQEQYGSWELLVAGLPEPEAPVRPVTPPVRIIRARRSRCDEHADTILARLAAREPQRAIAASLGIPHATLAHWIQRRNGTHG